MYPTQKLNNKLSQMKNLQVAKLRHLRFCCEGCCFILKLNMTKNLKTANNLRQWEVLPEALPVNMLAISNFVLRETGLVVLDCRIEL